MNKMKKALFLQSWYSTLNDNWYPWLEEQLEKKGYETNFTDIPEIRKDTPDMQKILKQIESMKFVDKNTTVIAHSIGSLLAMRLAEKVQFKRMILVSGWDFDDLTEGHKLFWKNKIDHAAIKKNVKEIYVVHSDNDPYITTSQAQDMANRLGAKFMLIKGGGHFQAKDGYTKMPKLLTLI